MSKMMDLPAPDVNFFEWRKLRSAMGFRILLQTIEQVRYMKPLLRNSPGVATAFGDCMVTKVCSEAFNKAPFTASLLTSCDSENHGATSDVCKMFAGI